MSKKHKTFKLDLNQTDNQLSLFELFNNPNINFNTKFFKLFAPTNDSIQTFHDKNNWKQQCTIAVIQIVYTYMHNNQQSVTDDEIITFVSTKLNNFIKDNQINIPSQTNISNFIDTLLHPKTGLMYTTGLLKWIPEISEIQNNQRIHEIKLNKKFTEFIRFTNHLITLSFGNNNINATVTLNTTLTTVNEFADEDFTSKTAIYDTHLIPLKTYTEQLKDDINRQFDYGQDLMAELKQKDITLKNALNILEKKFTDYSDATTQLNQSSSINTIQHQLKKIDNKLKKSSILTHLCDEFILKEYGHGFSNDKPTTFWNKLSNDAKYIISKNANKHERIMNKLSIEDQIIIQTHVYNIFNNCKSYFDTLNNKTIKLNQLVQKQLKIFENIYNNFLNTHGHDEINEILDELIIKFNHISPHLQAEIIQCITSLMNECPLDHNANVINETSFIINNKQTKQSKQKAKIEPIKDLTGTNEITIDINTTNPYSFENITQYLDEHYTNQDQILLSDHLDDFDILTHASQMSSYSDFKYKVYILNDIVQYHNNTSHDLLFIKRKKV